MGKILPCVDGVARTTKKMFANVDGTSRSVKKAYVPVDGVARKVFGNDGTLYDYGDECTDVTNGWAFPSIRTTGWQSYFDTNVIINNNSSIITPKNYTRNKNSNSMTFNISFGKTTLFYGSSTVGEDVLVRTLGVYTSKKIDLTNYSQLHFLVDIDVGATCYDDETYLSIPCRAFFAVSNGSPTSELWTDMPSTYCQAYKVCYDSDSGNDKEIVLDVSSLSGEYYIMADAWVCKNGWSTIRMVYVTQAHSNLTIKKVWLT